jgi:hypothetical protein
MFCFSVDIHGVTNSALLQFAIHNVKLILFFRFSYIISDSNFKYFYCIVGTEKLKYHLTKTKIPPFRISE